MALSPSLMFFAIAVLLYYNTYQESDFKHQSTLAPDQLQHGQAKGENESNFDLL